MTRLQLKHVHRFTDRHGIVRHYFRRPGYPRAPLPGLPGSAEFMAAYQAALAGERPEIGADRNQGGSIAALASAYYRSAEFRQLAKVTKATYRNIIEKFCREHGDKGVASLQREHVRRLIAARVETPAAANALLKMLHILMRFAVEDGWRRDDPTIGARKVKITSEGWHSWSEDEIAQFEAHWPVGSRAHLALALLLYTGQRKGDVIHMGRQHVRNGVLDIRQHKTGTRLSIPIHAKLAAALAAVPADQMVFLVTQGGAPFTEGGFGNWFRDRADAAGLPMECRAHGLRKAAARRLADAGCSSHEIKAITGHKTLKEVERYTRAVEQARLAVRAIAALGEAEPIP